MAEIGFINFTWVFLDFIFSKKIHPNIFLLLHQSEYIRVFELMLVWANTSRQAKRQKQAKKKDMSGKHIQSFKESLL